MPNYTTNYNLKKPLQEEFYNVDDFNENADIIDTQLKSRATLVNGKVPTSELPIGTANGIAGLDEDGNVPVDNLPDTVAILDSTGKLPTDVIPSDVGGNGKRTTRYTVGSSSYGWTSSDCDYLCDGTADEVEINNAIQALRSTGGEVVLLDGQYNLTGSIIMDKNNVTIRGNGNNTKLVRGFMGVYGTHGMIFITADYCEVRNLYLDGVRGTYNDGYQRGVMIDTLSQNCRVEGCYFINHGDNAIYSGGKYGIFVNNMFESNDYGIEIYYGDQNVVAGNTFTNNEYCIGVGSDGNSISNNTMLTTTYYAIDLSSSDSNSIVGNTSDGAKSGLYASYGTNNSIIGNVFNNSTKYGIELSAGSTGNILAGNTCIGNTSGEIYMYLTDNIQYSKDGHTHAASAITAGTFAGQVVANSGGQAAGTYLVRNQKLSASEETPTVNGQICWVYE